MAQTTEATTERENADDAGLDAAKPMANGVAPTQHSKRTAPSTSGIGYAHQRTQVRLHRGKGRSGAAKGTNWGRRRRQTFRQTDTGRLTVRINQQDRLSSLSGVPSCPASQSDALELRSPAFPRLGLNTSGLTTPLDASAADLGFQSSLTRRITAITFRGFPSHHFETLACVAERR